MRCDWYRLTADGSPVQCVSADEYQAWRDSPEGEAGFRVAEDYVNGIRVSTVFMGLDHSFDGGRGLLWETMTFGGESWGVSQECDRYYSREDAVAGHAAIVAKMRETKPPGLDAALRRLYDVERCLQRIHSSLWALVHTCEEKADYPASKVASWLKPHEEWSGKVLKAKIADDTARAIRGDGK